MATREFLETWIEKTDQPHGPHGSDEKTSTNPYSRPQPRKLEKMSSARRFLLGLLVFAAAFGLATAVSPKRSCHGRSGSGDEQVLDKEDSSFSRLLKSASPDALHNFLHAYLPDFKHGVFSSDESAVEAMKDDELATVMYDLAKRQNTTTEASLSVSESTAATTTPSKSAATATETTHSQDSATPTTIQDSSPNTVAPTETGQVTTTGTIIVSTQISMATTQPQQTAQTTQTTEQSATTTTQSTTDTGTSTTGTTLSTATATSSPTTTKPLRTSTLTSILPGGSSTYTSVFVVTGDADTASSTSSSAGGSLQTGNAQVKLEAHVLEVVLGAVVGGALLA